MHLCKRSLAVVAALAVFAFPAAANDGADFPSRLIKLVVAFPAGGGADALARMVAFGLERQLGKPVVVENISGANGSNAARATAHSAPDGYTIQFTDMSFVVSPHLNSNFGAKPLIDFEPIGFAASMPISLIVSASLGISKVDDLIKAAKERPEDYLFGHTGIGTPPYLAAIAFSKATGVSPRLVFYKGIGDATTNTMTGIISGYFSASSTALGASSNDRLKILATTGQARMPLLPNVPTFAESGVIIRGFEGGSWFGLVAPAGTPPAIVRKLNAALNGLGQDPEFKSKIATIGAIFKASSTDEFRDFLIDQDTLWRQIVAELGLKVN
jgi:tripartite-type tricarboxylate transporter receptor subunit TctC